jgi:putative endonuclease
METDCKPVSRGYFVYLACCANGTLYTGYSTNVQQRIASHNAGCGGRYTQTNRPIQLVAAWSFNSRAEALQAERQLKRLSPERKLALAESVAASTEGSV